MNALLAETTMKVLGKEVADPQLQMLGLIAFIPLFLGGMALVLTQRMVDEERLRAEPSVSNLFGRGIPPRRILTDFGKKVQTVAIVALGLGGMLMLYVIIVTR